MPDPIDHAGDATLAALVFAALENPATVDLAALARRADEFLIEAQGGCPDLLAAGRYMAGAAFALGVLGTAEASEDLKAAAQAFTMVLKLHQLHQL
jgi:hypothetical protein